MQKEYLKNLKTKADNLSFRLVPKITACPLPLRKEIYNITIQHENLSYQESASKNLKSCECLVSNTPEAGPDMRLVVNGLLTRLAIPMKSGPCRPPSSLPGITRIFPSSFNAWYGHMLFIIDYDRKTLGTG